MLLNPIIILLKSVFSAAFNSASDFPEKSLLLICMSIFSRVTHSSAHGNLAQVGFTPGPFWSRDAARSCYLLFSFNRRLLLRFPPRHRNTPAFSNSFHLFAFYQNLCGFPFRRYHLFLYSVSARRGIIFRCFLCPRSFVSFARYFENSDKILREFYFNHSLCIALFRSTFPR